MCPFFWEVFPPLHSGRKARLGMQSPSGPKVYPKAIPDLPHHPDKVMAVVTVLMTAEDILQRLEAA